MTLDTFLTCKNCNNWGTPWLLGKKKIICENKKDIEGKLYSSQHPACKYFIPITGLPEPLQRIRLFVQTLSLNQKAYFAWALAQDSLLLTCKDSDNNRLALGDQVTFRLGVKGHIGTVEGKSPKYKGSVIVNCHAFNGNISLLSSAVTKITKKKAQELLDCYDHNEDKNKWYVDCLIKEVTLLRARQGHWTKDDHRAVLLYEHQLQGIESNILKDNLQTSI